MRTKIRFTVTFILLCIVFTPFFSERNHTAHAAAQQKIGMFYLLWHCPASSSPRYRPSGTIYDNSKILAGEGDWGPVHAFHWWGKPAAGYYCLAENEDLLRQHAELLRDAGIDFVFVDATNQVNQEGSQRTIIAPFDKMIAAWSRVPGAPKIVPWVPITGKGDMVDYFDQKLTQYPQMAFTYRGKPLLLAMARKSVPQSLQYRKLLERYTIRTMWGLQKPAQLNAGEWSFLQPCGPDFKRRKGNVPCQQCMTYRNGSPEQISVTSAYQIDYMSNTDPHSPSSAVPKFHGRTFLRQLETAYQHPEVPIVTITGWNEWIAQRMAPRGGSDTLPNGNKIFVDAYNAEYNRDLEPGGGLGDYYYQLMKRGIALLRSNRDPMLALSETGKGKEKEKENANE